MPLANYQRDKMYEFAKLKMALTKQGFRFSVDNESYTIDFDPVHYGRKFSYHDPFVKLPFVNSYSILAVTKKRVSVYFNQWIDRHKPTA